MLPNHKEIDPFVLSSMWDIFLTSKDRIKQLCKNVRAEKGSDEFVSLFIDNTAQKLQWVNKIKETIGIEWTFDNHTIPRDKLKSLCDLIKNNRLDIHQTFYLKMTNGEITDKKAIGLLHQIFGNWCGSDFKMGDRHMKRVEGKRVDTSEFHVVPSKNYIPYFGNIGEFTKQNDEIDFTKFIEDKETFE
jgi:hypothetical protein